MQAPFPFGCEGRKRDGEESVKTEMYSSTSTGSGHADEGVAKIGAGEEGEGSSMVLGEGSERGIGGQLRERAERLERARRLLVGAGKMA